MHRHLTYFVSDVHLGLDVANPRGREERFVKMLRSIPSEETEALYLLGDVWDFWYEYKYVVPKGYVQVFAALQDLMSGGVKVYFFQGNHDIWTYSYFQSLGMIPLRQPYVTEIGGKRFCLGHGDGLGPGDAGYKFMRVAFHNKILQWMFSTLHPRIAFALGRGWSRRSRLAKSVSYTFRGVDEPLYKFCASFPEPVDFFIFGHYHCMEDMEIQKSRLLLLGDWITNSNWLVFDGKEITRVVEEV